MANLYVSGGNALLAGGNALASGANKETVTWHQAPALTRSYISEVTYDPSDYTTSEISDYAPATAVTSNTKPIGQTVDGVTYYNNVPNEETPFASSYMAGTLKPLDQVRWINSSTGNMRDIGGWSCDGGTVKYGKIYRSAGINAADEDLFINELGITMEIDLTADGVPAPFDGMQFVCADSYAMYALTPVAAWKTNLRALFDAVKYGRAVDIHCSMGADRTGTLICIIEGILGVSQSDCDKDYELTSFYTMRERSGNYQGGTADWAHLMSAITSLSGSTFRDKCVNFVASLGFTADEINEFRAAMIDGTPSTVTPSIATYTVTKTTSHATVSGGTTVDQYQSYEAEVTPDSGYLIDSVTVTMGGVDITSVVYDGKLVNNGSITITSNGTVSVDGYKTAIVNV